MTNIPRETTYWFCVIKQKVGNDWHNTFAKMFTNYSDALYYGRSFQVEGSISFIIFTRSTLPSELYDWAVEEVRKFHSLRIGDVVVK